MTRKRSFADRLGEPLRIPLVVLRRAWLGEMRRPRSPITSTPTRTRSSGSVPSRVVRGEHGADLEQADVALHVRRGCTRRAARASRACPAQVRLVLGERIEHAMTCSSPPRDERHRPRLEQARTRRAPRAPARDTIQSGASGTLPGRNGRSRRERVVAVQARDLLDEIDLGDEVARHVGGVTDSHRRRRQSHDEADRPRAPARFRRYRSRRRARARHALVRSANRRRRLERRRQTSTGSPRRARRPAR